jgi:hypothetical protein
MHTEHLQNVTIGRVLGGWLVAIAVTSLVVLAFIASGMSSDVPTLASSVASLIAVMSGFLAGGFFVGFRARRAPILHGVAMGLVSIVAWVIANLLSELFAGSADWAGLGAAIAVGLVLAQMVAATVGALLGYNLVLRGKPGLQEDMPPEALK